MSAVIGPFGPETKKAAPVFKIKCFKYRSGKVRRMNLPVFSFSSVFMYITGGARILKNSSFTR